MRQDFFTSTMFSSFRRYACYIIEQEFVKELACSLAKTICEYPPLGKEKSEQSGEEIELLQDKALGDGSCIS